VKLLKYQQGYFNPLNVNGQLTGYVSFYHLK